MDLTAEQKQSVAQWVNAGEELSQIQNRIQEEFGISMTYMDVRFLVDDLDLELQDKEEPEADKEKNAQASDVAQELEPVGEVSVEVDAVVRPGAVVSGSVVFTDGERATWQIDQMGRLGIIPSQEGYRPPEEDMAAFQVKLQEALEKKGF